MYPEDYDKIIAIANEVADSNEGSAIGITFFLAEFEKRLREMQADQKARTISSTDECAEPEGIMHYCDCRTHDPEDDSIITGKGGCRHCDGKGTWEEVPVQLIDGDCDGQEFYVKKSADHFVAMSGSDGFVERQKYVWDLDDDGNRKYFNDVKNPGKGIYWMRWDEWLG